MLFTGKQHCLHNFFFGGPTCNEYLSSCKISSLVVLRFWQYSSSTRLNVRRRRRRQRTQRTSFAVFPGCYVENIYFWRIYSFLYVLDIDVTRNGNNLKLKVKSEFSLSMGLMVIKHSNPYIHSTTVLCDNNNK